MRRELIALVVALSFLLTTQHPLLGRQLAGSERGERVYELVSPSVLLIKMTNAKGEVTGTASAFLVSADQLLTNAHVANAGAMSVLLGDFEIPCVVERVDTINDLALCRIAAKSGGTPLTFANEEPKSGATVFAVGNPRGLERTISQGLFTGFRVIEGQQVAQISAPISPGSSGGPVVNSEGKLIGVAVATRGDGQNLNFAVPLSVVRRFLGNETMPATASAMLGAAKSLQARNDSLPYAEAKDSEYQRNEAQLAELLEKSIAASSDLSELREIDDIASATFRSGIRVQAARKLLQLSKKPSADTHARYAEGLYWITNEISSAEIIEAETHATRAIELGLNKQEHFVLLGNIQRQRQRYLQAYTNFQRAVNLPFEATSSILFNLFRTARDLERDNEAVTWFNRSKRAGGVLLFQLIEYAKFLEERSRYAEAAVAYEEAAAAAPKTYQSICDAGKNYWSADEFDKSLAAHRECITKATGIEGSKDYIQLAHRLMAEILKNRNVFDQAEIHARQAIQLQPEDAFAYLYLAASLEGQQRPSEAVVAARAAVRLSDGKYSSMHFALGSALFDLKQYTEAAQAFQKAAELSPNESGSTYNVALCYYNLKFYKDAVRWYRETLRRNPNHPDKDEIARIISALSKM